MMVSTFLMVAALGWMMVEAWIPPSRHLAVSHTSEWRSRKTLPHFAGVQQHVVDAAGVGNWGPSPVEDEIVVDPIDNTVVVVSDEREVISKIEQLKTKLREQLPVGQSASSAFTLEETTAACDELEEAITEMTMLEDDTAQEVLLRFSQRHSRQSTKS